MASKKTTPKKKSNTPAPRAVPLAPLADRVVVRPLSADERGTKTPSGIIIPDSAQEKSSEGVVVAVGPGKYEDGALVPMTVAVGDHIMFSKYGHEEVKVHSEEYFIVSESNILAILNN